MKSFKETTLPNLFLNRLYRFGTKPFLYYKTEKGWEYYTWEEVGQKVETIGRALIAYGIKKGSKICLISENRPDWVIFDLAILSVGAVTVPIYSTSIMEQISLIIHHSDAEIVIVSNASFLEKIRKSGSYPNVGHWFCFEKTMDPSNCHSMNFIQEKSQHTDVATYYQTLSHILPTDLATIVYTSGTTGDPKGVCLTHENIVSNVTASVKMISIRDDDVSLSYLPLSHMLERMAGFFCFMYFGAKIYFAEDLQKLPENLLETRPTILISVPRLLEKFYNKVFETMGEKSTLVQKLFHHSLRNKNAFLHAIYSKLFFQKIREKMGGRLKFVVCGGAPLTPGIARFFGTIGIPVLQGYGLTETSPVISVNELHHNVIGSVGRVLDNLDVKTAQDDEILVKGPSIMVGYYKDEKATKEVFTPDGFFKTGDVGEYKDGVLKITDRIKELIVTSGGKKVAPQPIETELLHHPIIDQVCLVGEGMKTIGALIVPNKNYVMKIASQTQNNEAYAQLLNQDLIRQPFQKIIDGVNEHLSSYEQIKNFKLLEEPFTQENLELTPTLKLRRKFIFSNHQDEIKNLFRP